MRKTAAGFWVSGIVLIVAGAMLGGLYADRSSSCQSSLGVAAQSSSTTTDNCVLSFVAVHLGTGLMLVGLLLGLVAVGFTIKRSMTGPVKPGWYTFPDHDQPAFWDGERWEV